jgi:hypothetical protein
MLSALPLATLHGGEGNLPADLNRETLDRWSAPYRGWYYYFGVGQGGAHVMVAFSRDLVHWAAHPEPLYKAGGNPSGLDRQYAHKISLVHNPKDDTFYLHYCACGPQGRGIGLITSRPLAEPTRKAAE